MENGGNVTQAMRDVGYSEATINNPSNLTKSKGFIELCEENGLTDNLLIQSLVSDIKVNKGDRVAELALAFKIKGYFAQYSKEGLKDSRLLTIVFDNSFEQ
jgi:hypothetical protein